MMKVLEPAILIDFVAGIFEAAGATATGARQVANSLVTSDLVGHDSHGIVRVRQYLDTIDQGALDPAAEPAIIQETAVMTGVDARRGFGQIAARFAMELTIQKAEMYGLAATGLFNCNHVGRLGEWVQLAAEQALIGLAFCNGGAKKGSVTPYGSATRLLGTNPIAAAVPVSGRAPIVIDFATSVVAEGKVRVHRNRGQPIPEGWILRADGQSSTNPEDFYAGGVLLPAAGHKGYSLSLLVELLGGILTGHGSPVLPDFGTGNGVLFLILAPEAFRPAADFLADSAALCERVKAVSPAPGFAEVLLPGEPEQRTAARRQAEGISIDDTTWTHLTEAASRFEVAVPMPR
jgi:LDH2 family malate/lactate/ureidoglycolate dehydrogenase